MKDLDVGSVSVAFDGQVPGIFECDDLRAGEPQAEGYRKQPVGKIELSRWEREAETESAVEFVAALELHPLSSLILEHQLIGSLADALTGFAASIETETNALQQADLRFFGRVFREFLDGVHHEKEEAILLPYLSHHGFDWSDGPLAEIRREHRQERYLIDVLCQAATRSEAWNRDERRRIVANALALGDFQREHLCKENDQLFPAVTQRSSSSELSRLALDLFRFDAGVDRYVACAELRTLAEDLIDRYASSFD